MVKSNKYTFVFILAKRFKWGWCDSILFWVTCFPSSHRFLWKKSRGRSHWNNWHGEKRTRWCVCINQDKTNRTVTNLKSLSCNSKLLMIKIIKLFILCFLESRSRFLLSSHPAVATSVLEFPGEGEEGGEGGDWNVEHQLPQVPQAEQVEVA